MDYQTEYVQVGASFNTLEDLEVITLGDLTFELPKDLKDLQDSLGGTGNCVQVGYSLVDLENEGLFFYFEFFFFFPPLTSIVLDVPTASLTFYSVNCTTGEW